MGSPDYMAPELINRPEKGDPRSDVHAIGVVLRELLTGIPAGTGHAAKAVVSDPALAAICRKATHTDPALRYSDAAALAGQLTQWMAPKTSKTLVTAARPPASHRPLPAGFQPRPARRARQGSPGHWRMLKNCAIVSFLFYSIHLTMGAYQRRHEGIARQAAEQPSTAPMMSEKVVKKAPRPVFKSRDLVTIPSGAAEEASFQSLVRLGPARNP